MKTFLKKMFSNISLSCCLGVVVACEITHRSTSRLQTKTCLSGLKPSLFPFLRPIFQQTNQRQSDHSKMSVRCPEIVSISCHLNLKSRTKNDRRGQTSGGGAVSLSAENWERTDVHHAHRTRPTVWTDTTEVWRARSQAIKTKIASHSPLSHHTQKNYSCLITLKSCQILISFQMYVSTSLWLHGPSKSTGKTSIQWFTESFVTPFLGKGNPDFEGKPHWKRRKGIHLMMSQLIALPSRNIQKLLSAPAPPRCSLTLVICFNSIHLFMTIAHLASDRYCSLGLDGARGKYPASNFAARKWTRATQQERGCSFSKHQWTYPCGFWSTKWQWCQQLAFQPNKKITLETDCGTARENQHKTGTWTLLLLCHNQQPGEPVNLEEPRLRLRSPRSWGAEVANRTPLS